MNLSIYRQGDVLLTPVSKLPEGCVSVEGQEEKIVLAWSEVTSHHHRIEDHMNDATEAPIRDALSAKPAHADEITARAQAKARLWGAPSGERYLEVKEAVHLRHEEHAAHALQPGIYHLPTQMEYKPAELRRVMD